MDLLEKFNQVDLHGKMNLINENGEFIVIRQNYYNHNVNLYSLPGFYAEVYYNPRKNTITKIESITSSHKLNKFLSSIQLDIS